MQNRPPKCSCLCGLGLASLLELLVITWPSNMDVDPSFPVVNEGRDEVPQNVDFSATELLSKPKILKATEQPELHVAERADANATLSLEAFSAPASLQAAQYFHVYSERTARIKSAIRSRVERGFASESCSEGSSFLELPAGAIFPFFYFGTPETRNNERNTYYIIVDKILHTKLGEHCILIGTLFKEMPLKPSVLKEYSEERSIGPVPPRQSFVSDNDALVLEDDTGRIKLIGATADASQFVTGVVIGVRGVQVESGDFEVREIILPGMPPQKPIPSNKESTGRYVALVSGLKVGASQTNPIFAKLMLDYLAGFLGAPTEQSEFVSSVVRVIFAGNCFCPESDQPQPSKLRDPNKKLTRAEQMKTVSAIQELDRLMVEVATCMSVDLMPGPMDPSDFSMPQQPINRFLLPRSASQKTMNLVTNPYRVDIDGISILGTSGQPTDNIAMYMKSEGSVLDLLENTLHWRHIAPTAPDTLSSFPFKSSDPFILEQCPYIYFAGNQPQYESRFAKGSDGQIVRLISVPEFDKTKTFVLVNLDTLNCHPITVDSYSDAQDDS